MPGVDDVDDGSDARRSRVCAMRPEYNECEHDGRPRMVCLGLKFLNIDIDIACLGHHLAARHAARPRLWAGYGFARVDDVDDGSDAKQ